MVEPDPLFEPGDWVQVWARVSSRETHPEDLTVSVDSHNASPNAVFDVLRTWVSKPDRLPEFAQTCTAMRLALAGYWWRCELHEGHGGDEHSANGGMLRWDKKQTSGYIEEA